MSQDAQALQQLLDDTFTTFNRVLETRQTQLQSQEIGIVKFVGQGIAHIAGLPGVKAEEIVRFPGSLLGMVFNLDAEEVGVILLDKSEHLKAGCEVRRTGRVLDVPVGKTLLGARG